MTVPPSEELESAVVAIVEGADAAAAMALQAEGLAQLAGILATYWQALAGVLPKRLAEEVFADYTDKMHGRCIFGAAE